MERKGGGIPHGTFLLAFYENQNDDVDECLLLRAIRPAKLPTDNDVIASMVEYYKDNLKTSGKSNQLDDFTKYTFSFSGLECSVLETFFKDQNGQIQFGADVENFYSAHNYVAYKPIGGVLEQIVNFRDGSIVIGCKSDVKIGKVRYSSSTRFQETQTNVPVYVNPQDFLGKRTALFGMTRTGKSNTVKKVIEATTEASQKVRKVCLDSTESASDNLKAFDASGVPKYKVGQIIFDINGEYANANLQDEGTAIFEKYTDITTRYSVLSKPGFKVLKVNFYNEIETGFELITSLLSDESGDYIKSFLSTDIVKPDDDNPYSSANTRWERKVAAYKCCLYVAGFPSPSNFKVSFDGNSEINGRIIDGKTLDPKKGLSLDDAIKWFWWVVDNIDIPFLQITKGKKDMIGLTKISRHY